MHSQDTNQFISQDSRENFTVSHLESNCNVVEPMKITHFSSASLQNDQAQINHFMS